MLGCKETQTDEWNDTEYSSNVTESRILLLGIADIWLVCGYRYMLVDRAKNHTGYSILWLYIRIKLEESTGWLTDNNAGL